MTHDHVSLINVQDQSVEKEVESSQLTSSWDTVKFFFMEFKIQFEVIFYAPYFFLKGTVNYDNTRIDFELLNSGNYHVRFI